MDKKLLLALGVIGILGYSYYAHLQKMKKNPKQDKKSIEAATEIEKLKYTNAFLTQYDIILPPNKASKILTAEAFGIQDNRKAKEIQRMSAKPPVII